MLGEESFDVDEFYSGKYGRELGLKGYCMKGGMVVRESSPPFVSLQVRDRGRDGNVFWAFICQRMVKVE